MVFQSEAMTKKSLGGSNASGAFKNLPEGTGSWSVVREGKRAGF